MAREQGEPYGYMGFHDEYAPNGEFESQPLTDADKAAGWREIVLYDRDEVLAVPIPMVLHCPSCGTQHIDKPDPADNWDNPPHTSHKCVGPNGCGCIWRPADVPTMGVERIETRGKTDNWSPPTGDPDVDRMDGGSGELGAEEIDGPYDA